MRTLLCLLLALLPLAAQTKYEMSHYVVGFLRNGPAWTAEETAETRRIKEGHMANVRKMVDSGKLIVAGPFEDNGELRGMFIFNVTSVEEARTLAEPDPLIQSHRMVLELHPWSAGKGLKVGQ